MTKRTLATVVTAAVLLGPCGLTEAAGSPNPTEPAGTTNPTPAPLDMAKAQAEVDARYSKAHREVKEYILWTAKTFGPRGMWLNEDAFAALPQDAREQRIQDLASLFEEAEYGRHLCAALAEASAFKSPRLVRGLMKLAGYHKSDQDYDCRPKWMALAALARQESEEAVPLLISLVDHGNQNTRFWARAALARKTGQDFGQDKDAWAKAWQSTGHPPVDPSALKPWTAPPQKKP